MKAPFLAAAVILALTKAGSASTAQRSVEDCERLRNAHEYNLCLASFGPKARASRVSTSGPPDEVRNPSSAVPATARPSARAAARPVPGGKGPAQSGEEALLQMSRLPNRVETLLEAERSAARRGAKTQPGSAYIEQVRQR